MKIRILRPRLPVPQQKVHVSTFDQLGSLNSQQLHHPIGLRDAFLNGLIDTQDNLELEEVPEVFNYVQVNSGAPDKEKRPKFVYSSGLAVGQGQ